MKRTPLSRSFDQHGLAYHECGDPQHTTLVLIHGVGLNADSWYRQIEHFSESCHVYAIDLPGHGQSRPLPDDATLNDFVLVLQRFLQEVVREPAILAGHSMGALLTLAVAIEHPAWVQGLAALNAVYQRPAAAREQIRERAAKLLESNSMNVITAPLQRWFGEHPEGELAELALQVEEWLGTVDRVGYATAYRVFAECDGIEPARLATLMPPALFMTGALDHNSSAEMTFLMANTVHQGSALVLDGERHMMLLTAAGTVNSALQAFMQTAVPLGSEGV